ncbi:helix-turn-helix transcriptional regulator [Chloroflexota bacterium]
MTDAELVVLSLVAEGPQHGYQIQQAIEARGVRAWTTIGFSSVYYVLNKLEENGLLHSKMTASPRGPARKVYSLAEAGRRILQTAVADLLSTPHDTHAGLVLGLANMHHLRPQQVRHALDTYESQLRSRLADLTQLQQVQEVRPHAQSRQNQAIFAYGIHMVQAELAWLTDFRQTWDEEDPARPDEFGPPVDSADVFPANRDTPTPAPQPTEKHPRSPESDS